LLKKTQEILGIKSLILQKFGINKSMRVMICFSKIRNKVLKKVMMHYLYENIQIILKIGKVYVPTLK
jgi:hypothetical protein